MCFHLQFVMKSQLLFSFQTKDEIIKEMDLGINEGEQRGDSYEKL